MSVRSGLPAQSASDTPDKRLASESLYVVNMELSLPCFGDPSLSTKSGSKVRAFDPTVANGFRSFCFFESDRTIVEDSDTEVKAAESEGETAGKVAEPIVETRFR